MSILKITSDKNINDKAIMKFLNKELERRAKKRNFRLFLSSYVKKNIKKLDDKYNKLFMDGYILERVDDNFISEESENGFIDKLDNYKKENEKSWISEEIKLKNIGLSKYFRLLRLSNQELMKLRYCYSIKLKKNDTKPKDKNAFHIKRKDIDLVNSHYIVDVYSDGTMILM